MFCRYLFLCIPFFSYAIIEIFLVFPRIFLVILKLYCYYIILGFDLSISRFSSLLLKLHYALLKMLAYYLITRFWIQFGIIRIFSVNLKWRNWRKTSHSVSYVDCCFFCRIHLYVLSKRAPIFWPDELPEYILVYLTSGWSGETLWACFPGDGDWTCKNLLHWFASFTFLYCCNHIVPYFYLLKFCWCSKKYLICRWMFSKQSENAYNL